MVCIEFKNTTINKFNENITEIVHYKTDFIINKNSSKRNLNEYIDYETGEVKYTNRNLVKNSNGIFIPVDPLKPYSEIVKSLRKSARRSKDNFYGYGLANTWKYFLTITFDKNEVNRNDDEEVKKVWSSFRKSITRRKGFEDIKILMIPERHDNGSFHFHGLIGNVDLSKYLTPAINNSEFLGYYDYEKQERVFKLDKNGNKILNKYYGKELKTQFGDTVYNFDLWKHGYSTVVIINEEENQLKVLNYMLKYVTKDNNVGYNKKSYYRTRNLNFKETETKNYSDSDIAEILNSYNLDYEIIKKETNTLVSYKIIKKNKKEK